MVAALAKFSGHYNSTTTFTTYTTVAENGYRVTITTFLQTWFDFYVKVPIVGWQGSIIRSRETSPSWWR